MAGRTSVDFLLLFLLVIVGFAVFGLLGKEDVVGHYYDAFVSFNWMPGRAYFEGYYDAFGGTVGGWLREGDHALQPLLASPYVDVIRKGLIGYAIFAVICMLLPSYRHGLYDFFHGYDFKEYSKVLVVFLGLTALSFWAFVSAPGFQPKHLSNANEAFSSLLVVGLTLIGLPSFLGIGIIVVSSVIWVPVVLFGLPWIVFAFVSSVLRFGFLVLLSPFKALFFLWHYLHYLFVPHPMEGKIKTYEKVRLQRGVKIDHTAFGKAMASAKYDPKRDGIPVWWKSKNLARRLKNAMALRERVTTEKQVADEYIDDIRERNKQQR